MHLIFALPVVQRAIDPVGWIIAAIVVFNLLSPLFSQRKRRLAEAREEPSRPVPPAQTAAPQAAAPQATAQLQRAVQSRQQSAQSVQQSSQSVQQSVPIRMRAVSSRLGTLSDADKEKLRQALTAAGVSTLAAEVQRRVAAAPPSPVFAPAARMSVASAATLPAPELPPPATTDGLTLMTLESGTTAFNRLGAPTAAGGTTQANIAFSFRSNPRAVANAFVAAAIVGPCAALRSLGHTPAGW
ncbi:MAG: hypothetical protein M3Z37_04470 [Candidatus Eremiobacteraeota bacterium]|nr:hypothetical protein [Candidatus Eremiobacteraeota bacterium]